MYFCAYLSHATQSESESYSRFSRSFSAFLSTSIYPCLLRTFLPCLAFFKASSNLPCKGRVHTSKAATITQRRALLPLLLEKSRISQVILLLHPLHSSISALTLKSRVILDSTSSTRICHDNTRVCQNMVYHIASTGAPVSAAMCVCHTQRRARVSFERSTRALAACFMSSISIHASRSVHRTCTLPWRVAPLTTIIMVC
jgi:hypothetical protein